MSRPRRLLRLTLRCATLLALAPFAISSAQVTASSTTPDTSEPTTQGTTAPTTQGATEATTQVTTSPMTQGTASPTTSAPVRDTVVVRKVLSGTTVLLESGERVTLLGIGIPRSRVLDPDLVRDNLAGIIEGRAVVLVDDATSRSRSGRRGASRASYLYYDGSLINLELIEDGFATASSTAHSRLAEFKAAEKLARSRQLVAWSSEGHLSSRCTASSRNGRCRALTRHISGRCEKHR
jgi:endonuclease YncB( thermonuclease family)